MKLLRVLAAITLAISLAGCASLVQSTVKALYGDSQYTRDATKAVAIGMAGYDKGVQPQIERYMSLPPKGSAECAAVKVSLLCRDQAVAERLDKADEMASSAIHKARLVIDGIAEDDTGTALTDAATAMQAAETQFLTTVSGAKP